MAREWAGESCSDTYELEADATRPAVRASASLGMALSKFLAAEQEGTVPGQEDLRREDHSGGTRFILAVAEADLEDRRF